MQSPAPSADASTPTAPPKTAGSPSVGARLDAAVDSLRGKGAAGEPNPAPEARPTAEPGSASGAAGAASTGEDSPVEPVRTGEPETTESAVVEEVEPEAAQLLRDIQDISFAKIAAIIAGATLIIWLTRRLLPFLAERGPSQARLYLLAAVPVLRMVVILLTLGWIIPLVFNVTFENFLVIGGAASVAIGFAFKDYAASLIAGVVAIFERPYRAGDWVEIDGDYGEVRSVGMRAIQLQTADDNTITVPHDRIWSNNISNANDGARTLMCVANFYLAPDHDAAAVRAALEEVALTSAYLSYGHPVAVMLSQQPLGTQYKIKAYPFDLRDQFRFVTDLTVRGKLAVAAAGGQEIQASAVSDSSA